MVCKAYLFINDIINPINSAISRTPTSSELTFSSTNQSNTNKVDAQGNIYVADTWNARVQKFDAAGTFLKSWGTGNDIGNNRSAMMTDGTEAGNNAAPLGFYGPRGLAIDAQGNVYVADTWNGRVQIFGRDESGKVIALPKATWRVQGWQPNTYDDPFLSADAAGQVFASVPSRNQLLFATNAGEPLLRWGGAGTDFASITLPSGVAAGPDGTVYVVDRGNNRLLRFKMPIAGP